MKQTLLAAPRLGPGRPNLVVAGPSGSGKSSSGRSAAASLGMPFVDLDQLSEQRSGLAVAELFARHGEGAFRQLEAELLAQAARLSGTVVAVGGGAVLHPSSFASLAGGAMAAVLTAAPEELGRRLRGDRLRPLLGPDPGSGLAVLLAARGPDYRAAGTQVDTSGRPPQEVAGMLVRLYRDRVRSQESLLEVGGADGGYPVIVGPQALDRLPGVIAARAPARARVVVVSDATVAAVAARRVAALLREQGQEVLEAVVAPGEAAKRLEVVSHLWSELLRMGVGRNDVVVAVGGGATLDAVGFCAATLGRGTAWVTVPTTLLAMVDAAIGGKTAINHGGLKNSVGAFHPPLAVVAELSWLASLPAASTREGMAEATKCAVLASPIMVDLLGQAELDGSALPIQLQWVVEQAARIKAAYVGADPREQGLRAALNLGHTFAHALEAASDYRIGHGRAVAIGLRAAARLGASVGLTEPALVQRLDQVLDHLRLTPEPGLHVERESVLRAARGDKKRVGTSIAFIVPAGRGAVRLEDLDLDRALQPLWEVLAMSALPPGSHDRVKPLGPPTGVRA
ncbi:MAG: bifunctional shikimate kinase/3-dehydroquinate synthase [Candidatus Dormibacteria bacterium]